MIAYFLAVSASQRRAGGGVAVIPCVQDDNGNFMCKIYCEAERFRTGRCARIKGDRFICQCLD